MVEINILCTRKYKDELPLHTVRKIRNILNDLGILAVETCWNHSADGFYSVSLKIGDTNLTTNGKGTSYEYALASAYGEMMERLQNQAPFRLNTDLSEEALQYKGFYYAPDEKHLSMAEVLNSKEDWMQKQTARLDPSIDKKELLQKWQGVSYEKTPSDFIALPYLNVKTHRLSYIPIKMISKMYMSNGMCAGNTQEEALVQGLSEVLERHVNKKILNEKVTPPTIPNDHFKTYPRIAEMITKIKSSGNYDVIVKDCSLNQGYPVIGVIFINKADQTYFIKFGAHPIFEIAVERTLTELLQGQNVNSMMGTKEFSYKSGVEDDAGNLMGILVNGSGYYPTELFGQKFSYDYKAFEDVRQLSNREMAAYLIGLVESKGYDIFIRDVSFLGFPSFHIIVPGLSEVNALDDIKEIEEYAAYNNAKRSIRNFDPGSDEQTEELIRFFNHTRYNSQASIVQMLNLPTKNMFPWYYVKIDLFIGAVHYTKGNFAEAYDAFNRYIRQYQANPCNRMEKIYYKCVRDYIGARIDYKDEQDAIAFLSTFYPIEIIHAVMTDLGNPEQVLNRYGQLSCWNCGSCKLKANCLYEGVEKIYKALKDQYAACTIDQNHLKNLLSLS